VTTGGPALFRFAVSQGPSVLVHRTAINNGLLATYVCTEGVGNVFLRPAGMRQVLQPSYRTPKFRKTSEPTGSDCRQMLKK